MTLEPFVRSHNGILQVEFHVLPIVVQAGSEDYVLVSDGNFVASTPYTPTLVSSFLGVQPGDQVELAVDILTGENMMLYNRSLHKEGWGIYDAWDHVKPLELSSSKFHVTITCRVNGDNRDKLPQALFEGLVRLTLHV